MQKRKMDTRYMATLAMLCGVLLVMGMTGIGFIPLPVIKATTMHIPVILGAVLLGIAYFMAVSIQEPMKALALFFIAVILAFAFSPFMTTEGLPGVLKSLWIALGCRILLGVIAGWLWRLTKRTLKQDYLALPVTAAVSTICHTILVMGSIYLLLAQQYAQAKNVAVTAVFGLVMGTVTASGIPEAIIAAVLVTVIGKALLRLTERMKKR